MKDIRTRIRRWRWRLRRAALPPTFVRLTIAGAAGVAMLLAYPPQPGLLVLPVLAALFPQSIMVTADIIVTVLLWLASTSVQPDRLTLWRLCLLAIMLYVVHVAAAMCAVLPYDAAMAPGTLRPWLVRLGVVIVLTGALGAVIYAMPRLVSGAPRLVGATVAGLVLMVTTGFFIAYLGRRRQ